MASEVMDRSRPRVENPAGIVITYADDAENGRIYWRCESEDCPSRITEPGRDRVPFVGTIDYTDRTHGMTLLGSVAVAHAMMLDAAPLAAMHVGEVVADDPST